MNCRYLFLCPDITSASGGVAVIHDIVSLLNQSGWNAALVHNGPNAGYPDYPLQIPRFYTRKIWNAQWKHSSNKERIKMVAARMKRGSKKLLPLKLRPTDIIVTPEFQLAEAIEAFPENPIIVLVQNPFGLMMSLQSAYSRGINPRDAVVYWLGMSEVCRTHMDVLGLSPNRFFTVSMKPLEFPFRQQKQRLITYMPRKRPWEAAIIAEALTRRGNVGGYRVEALDNMTRHDVASRLQDSLIFISLLQQESLGFPAAEAMASGCIVVGFDGLGGAEFFDKDVGVPVKEGDVASVVMAVERTVAQYESDPTKLDLMRLEGSKRINKSYNTDNFRDTLISMWREMEKEICKSWSK